MGYLTLLTGSPPVKFLAEGPAMEGLTEAWAGTPKVALSLTLGPPSELGGFDPLVPSGGSTILAFS